MDKQDKIVRIKDGKTKIDLTNLPMNSLEAIYEWDYTENKWIEFVRVEFIDE